MKFLKIAGKDLRAIRKNKFVAISIVAILVVPMLYSLLYLDAFWDPYAKLADVPVAVVNNDTGAKLDGDDVNYGSDIIDELKGNSEIGWKFTNENDALDGLNGDKYYAVVQIPKNFSSDVIAAKESAPKVADITFTCNDKKNFLASQINSKVQSELKESITATIANNYVTVAFDNLYKAKDGMVAAADGSTQIKDGLTELNGKIPEMTDGVNQLLEGSNTLTDAQKTLNGGINTLNGGTHTLNGGAASLNSGTKDLNSGVSTLKGKVPELSNGVNSLADGSGKLFNSYTGQILPGINDVNNGLNTLNSKLIQGKNDAGLLYNGATNIEQKTPLLINGANELKSQDKAITDGYSKLIVGGSQVNDGVNQVVLGSQFTNKEIENVGNSINEMIKANPELANDPNMKNIIESLSALNSKKADMQTGLNSLSNGSAQLNAGINDFNEKALKPYMSGTNNLADSTIQYANGSNQVAQGSKQLIGNVSQATDAVGQLSEGTNKLYSGMTLTNKQGFGYGLASVKQGSEMLNSKIPELNSGINQLSVGSGQLNDGSKALLSGSNQLVAGANDLQNGSTAILDGQVKLNNGITDLHSQLPQLSSGVSKLHDGSVELSDKLNDGANEMNSGLMNSSDVMGDFVSKPMNLEANPINPVPNYGTGFAPYFIPLSLWIGAIMMFFVIKVNVDEEEKDASKLSKVLGKFVTFGTVGILQALLVSFVVVVFLGLQPTSMLAFVGTNIILSLVFVGIVQCLILLLGDAGRLLAIVFLILQLTGCAGTFPLEVVPSFFKVLNPFMPFTYAVQALREVISATSINYTVIMKDFAILGVFLVAFLGICTIFRDKGEKLVQKMEAIKAK